MKRIEDKREGGSSITLDATPAAVPSRFPRPAVMLIDVAKSTAEALLAVGFDVAVGTFGSAYEASPTYYRYCHVDLNHDLSHLAEKDIVVVDLEQPPVGSAPKPRPIRDGDPSYYIREGDRIVDPRPLVMRFFSDEFSRVLSAGGIVIVFAKPSYSITYHLASREHGSLSLSKESPFNNWSFLGHLSEKLEVRHDSGKDIRPNAKAGRFSSLLNRHIARSTFSCAFNPRPLGEQWVTLATNRHGGPVAGAIVTREKGGVAFVFHEVGDKDAFLVDLMKNVLPDMVPDLFPYSEERSWIHNDDYEIPEVLRIASEIALAKSDHEGRIAKMEASIADVRSAGQHHYDLLRGTDDQLVVAVINALKTLGFQQVVDVDAEVAKAGGGALRREDVRVLDASPALVVEVKGIGGTPEDEESLGVLKNVTEFMKEAKRFDVQGLSIINHQRHLPPLNRDNKGLFRDVVLNTAKAHKLGLLTTWDLHRLVQSFVKNRWTHAQVASVIYRIGRIEPIPDHYEYVGVVAEVWDKAGAIGIEVTEVPIKSVDRVAFELPTVFEEQDVGSIRLNDEPAEEAPVGTIAGLLSPLRKPLMRKGIKVYRIRA